MTQLSSDSDIQACLRGDRLYGDDFSPEQIARWYADEKEGYADLGAKNESTYEYPYHAMNIAHGFNHLPANQRFTHAMGFGAAYGEELKPLLSRIDRITIMDPSDAFVKDSVGGVPAQWVKPDPSGRMPFPIRPSTSSPASACCTTCQMFHSYSARCSACSSRVATP